MSLSKADLLLHPIRGRILMVLARRRMTTRQIAHALPDISQASVYRHVAVLAEAGVLQVVEEIPIRGVIERVYAFDEDAALVRPDEMTTAAPDDYLRYFQMFVDDLMQIYRRYAGQENAHPNRDGVAFWGEILHLTREERREVGEELRSVTRKRRDNEPRPDRLRYYIGRVFIPDSSEDGLPQAAPEDRPQ